MSKYARARSSRGSTNVGYPCDMELAVRWGARRVRFGRILYGHARHSVRAFLGGELEAAGWYDLDWGTPQNPTRAEVEMDPPVDVAVLARAHLARGVPIDAEWTQFWAPRRAVLASRTLVRYHSVDVTAAMLQRGPEDEELLRTLALEALSG